jgi:hypothetical protein
MDWIERLFGIDPDFGSGALEILIAGAVVVIVVGFALWRGRASRRVATRRCAEVEPVGGCCRPGAG